MLYLKIYGIKNKFQNKAIRTVHNYYKLLNKDLKTLFINYIHNYENDVAINTKEEDSIHKNHFLSKSELHLFRYIFEQRITNIIFYNPEELESYDYWNNIIKQIYIYIK